MKVFLKLKYGTINSIETILISSEYGDGKVYGQPKSVKTISLIKVAIKRHMELERLILVYSPELIDVVNFLNIFSRKKIDDSLDITF